MRESSMQMGEHIMCNYVRMKGLSIFSIIVDKVAQWFLFEFVTGSVAKLRYEMPAAAGTTVG